MHAELHAMGVTLPRHWDKDDFFQAEPEAAVFFKAQTTACLLDSGMFLAEGGNQTHWQTQQTSQSLISQWLKMDSCYYILLFSSKLNF